MPFKMLGEVDVSGLIAHVETLSEAQWEANAFRQEVLADGVHAVTKAILMRHEWDRWRNPWRMVEISELIEKWAKQTGRDPRPFMPIDKQETDVGPIYTFPDWPAHEAAIQPVIDQVLALLKYPHPVVTRIALVRLEPGAVIAPHIDGQPMAEKAHRIHVPLSNAEGVEYKVDGKKFKMRKGRAYDFNNRKRHSVRNLSKRPRVNMFVDVYPASGLHVPPPFGYYATDAIASVLKPDATKH
ncbi:MAG: aspartyl/asparaginyl beta-hydroxylase domain-containing protein [Alphaproteobacteria bacterium]